MNYTVDYFIRKFTAIPSSRWTTGEFVRGKKCCVLGHCGVRIGKSTLESRKLNRLLGWCRVVEINDGKDLRYQQRTPKARILAALRDVKEGK